MEETIKRLIEEASNKMSRQKIAVLEMKVMQLNNEIENMKRTIKQLQDINNFSFD